MTFRKIPIAFTPEWIEMHTSAFEAILSKLSRRERHTLFLAIGIDWKYYATLFDIDPSPEVATYTSGRMVCTLFTGDEINIIDKNPAFSGILDSTMRYYPKITLNLDNARVYAPFHFGIRVQGLATNKYWMELWFPQVEQYPESNEYIVNAYDILDVISTQWKYHSCIHILNRNSTSRVSDEILTKALTMIETDLITTYIYQVPYIRTNYPGKIETSPHEWDGTYIMTDKPYKIGTLENMSNRRIFVSNPVMISSCGNSDHYTYFPLVNLFQCHAEDFAADFEYIPRSTLSYWVTRTPRVKDMWQQRKELKINEVAKWLDDLTIEQAREVHNTMTPLIYASRYELPCYANYLIDRPSARLTQQYWNYIYSQDKVSVPSVEYLANANYSIISDFHRSLLLD